MIWKEILFAPWTISWQGQAPIEHVIIDPIITEDTETINFNEAKDLFANLNTNELLGPDSLKCRDLTTNDLLSIFWKIPTTDTDIKLEDIDMEKFKTKIKKYAIIANYAYKLQERKKDSIYHHYIEELPEYPLIEPDYALAAEYEKKIIDLYSIAISWITIEPGENYAKLEPQIVRLLVHTMKKFNKYISSDQEKDLQKIIWDLGWKTSDIEDSLKAVNYPSVSEEERKEYKKLIEKMTTKARYLTNDFNKNKTFELYFPITEKYTLLAQALAIITNNHAELARAINIEAWLLEEKTRYIPLNQNENMQRAIETIKKAESELALVWGSRPWQSENNIGEIYFNVKAYPMAMMAYEQSLDKKKSSYIEVSEALHKLEDSITQTTDSLSIDIKSNKKEGREIKISADKLDKYFLDYEDASKDFGGMITAFEEKTKIYKTVSTKEFSQTIREIFNTLTVIKAKLKYIKENEKYTNIAWLEKIKEHIVVLSDLLWDAGMITGIDAPYINIWKTNIVMGTQKADENILQKGKEYLDIAEAFQKFLKNDDAEVNYYLWEYYKYARDFRNAQKYFLKVYTNPNADIEYRYKAVSGMEFTSFTYKEKFGREAEEEKMKVLYEKVSQRIQNSMNEYAAVVAEEESAQAEQNKIKTENEQASRERDQREALIRQKTIFWALWWWLLLLISFLGLWYARRKNRIIAEQKKEVEDKNIEVEQQKEEVTKQKEEVERVTGAVNKSWQAILIKTPDGSELFSNEVYKDILKQNIVSPRGNMAKMFEEVVETWEERIFNEIVIWDIDQTKVSKEDRKKIEEERGKSISKYLFLKEDWKEIIREQRYYKITLTPSLDAEWNITEVASISDDITKEELDKQVQKQQKVEIEQQKIKVEKQAGELRKQYDDITASISYAERIQAAVLPQKKQLDEHLGEHFVLFKPKDVVSWDFYWTHQCKNDPNKVIFATVDCTGHGVPWAFMSMLGKSFLDEIVNTNENLTTWEILEQLHLKVKLALKEKKDGMDMSICILDKKTRELQYSGARSEIYLRNPGKKMSALHGFKRKEKTTLLRGNLLEPTQPEQVDYPLFKDKYGEIDIIEIAWIKRGINESMTETRSFETHSLTLEPGTIIYSSSDGYQDQIGGNHSRKLMKKTFRKLLIEVSGRLMEEQKRALDIFIKKRRMQNPEWDQIQLDDMVVMWVKV